MRQLKFGRLASLVSRAESVSNTVSLVKVGGYTSTRIRLSSQQLPLSTHFLSSNYNTTAALQHSDKDDVIIHETKKAVEDSKDMPPEKLTACGNIEEEEDEEDEEEMFVEPYDSFEYKSREWGGPRRGGTLPEPTRFGDWERKGRCTDF